MLYKGEAKYTDNDQLRNDLFTKELKTIIVADLEQEEMRREQGYVDLADLMYKPKAKVIHMHSSPSSEETVKQDVSETTETVKEEQQPEVRVKRKYTRRVQNVGNDPA